MRAIVQFAERYHKDQHICHRGSIVPRDENKVKNKISAFYVRAFVTDVNYDNHCKLDTLL